MTNPAVIQQVKARVLKGIRDIPSLPVVVNQVIQLLNTPNSSSAQIADLISYDPGLTSRILRMVNSSAYGIPRQLTNIQQSIALLGYGAVRGLVLGASVCKMIGKQGAASSGNLDVEEFWEHSLMTSFLARRIATLYQLPDADEIFSAAMLHNIGILLLYSQAPDIDKVLHSHLKKVQAWRYSPHAFQVEHQALGFTHMELGRELAERWQLPLMMQAVMGNYVSPVEDDEDYESAVFSVSLAHYVMAALNTHHGVVDAVSLEDIPLVARTYFSLETDEELQAISQYIEPLKAESAEIRAALLGPSR
jgi:HD-like signal output (HDOD) protein